MKLIRLLNPALAARMIQTDCKNVDSNVLQHVSQSNSVHSPSSMQYANGEEYNFIDTSHSVQVLTGLNHLRQAKQLCDITLCVGGQKFQCHRIVLASVSSYFNAMFTGKLAESTQDHRTLNAIDATVMELLINYAYTSEIKINRQNVQALLCAANLLEILPVKDACEFYIGQTMDDSNCIGIHCYAEAHAYDMLQQKSKKYILANFCSVSLQKEFLELEYEKLKEIVMDDNLEIESEEQLVESAGRWLNFDHEGRHADFQSVFDQVLLQLPMMRGFLWHTLGP